MSLSNGNMNPFVFCRSKAKLVVAFGRLASTITLAKSPWWSLAWLQQRALIIHLYWLMVWNAALDRS